MRKGDAQSANGNGKILIIIIDSFKFKGAFVVRVVFPIKRNSRGEHPTALKLPLLPLSSPSCPYFHFEIKKIVIFKFFLHKITFLLSQ